MKQRHLCRVPPIGLLVLGMFASSCDESRRVVEPLPDATYDATLVLLDESGIERTVFGPGDPITFSLRVRNLTAEPQRISLASTQRYDFTVTGVGNATTWSWSHDKRFAYLITHVDLAPGQTLTYSEEWTQVDDDGNAVPAAEYDAHGFMPIPGWSDTDPEEVASSPVRFEIR